MVADGERRDAVTQLDHHTRGLVATDGRANDGKVPLTSDTVGVADAARHDPDPDLAEARRTLVDVVDDDERLSRSGHQRSSHISLHG